jgi:putative protein-disulfide isomerase
MCSWCWGYRPVWNALQRHLPESINIEYVVGGLAPDSDLPMPIEMQHTIQGHWRNIQTKLGTQFNFGFWKVNEPRRSTYMACRAVLAAKSQGFEIEMIDAIQRGYYLRALNPSNIEILNQIAGELCALQPERDLARFSLELLSSKTQQELERQIQKARLLTHQGFPSLVLKVTSQHHALAIDYNHYQNTLADIVKLTK